MIIAYLPGSTPNPEDGVHRMVCGTTTVIPHPNNASVPGFSNNGWAGGAVYAVSMTTIDTRRRWRASKGSAPVNRFTRSFGDNTTEGWHRSMPVGIEVTLGTTATVAAMFVLGASSTAEQMASASAAGAFVLGLAAIAQSISSATAEGALSLQVQSTANASTKSDAVGTLTAGVSSVAASTSTAVSSGQITLKTASVAEVRAIADAAARFVLGVLSSAIVHESGPGLIIAALTWVSKVSADLMGVARYNADLTHQPRHDADLTHVSRYAGDHTYKTRD